MSQTKPSRPTRSRTYRQRKIWQPSPTPAAKKGAGDEATRLRHEIAILESKKQILETLDELGA